MNLETENTLISRNDGCIIWFFAILYVNYTNKLTALKIQKGIPINDGTVIHANVVEILTNIWYHIDIQCLLCGIQSVLFNSASGASELVITLGKEYLLIFGQHPNNFAKLTLLKRTAIQHTMPDFLSKCLLLPINLYRSKIDLLKIIVEFAKIVTSCSSIENLDIALKECMAKMAHITTIPAKTVKVIKSVKVTKSQKKQKPNVSIDNKRGRSLDATLIMATKMRTESAARPAEDIVVSDNKRERALDATLIMATKMRTESAARSAEDMVVSGNKRARALDAALIMATKMRIESAARPAENMVVSDNKRARALENIVSSINNSAIDNKRARALSAVYSITEQSSTSGQELYCKEDCEVNIVPLFISSSKVNNLLIDTV